jgi:D-cysteine desulfhydrase family pyridoxal phosphate-dependent enzyme
VTARVALAQLPTPVEALDRLSEWLGGPRILVKRDDQTGLALGGNKARKLEFLCGEALEQGCDVLVTGGGQQSNHVRMTAAAANRLGLDCEIVLGGDPPELPSGNVLLDRVLGATLHFTGLSDYYAVENAIAAAVEQLARAGRRPYLMPIGGASITGARAYVEASDELGEQLPAFDWVIVADGSGGTHAGLLAGLGERARVVGVDVGTRPDLDEQVPLLATEVAAATGRKPPASDAVVIDHTRYGAGYAKMTPEALEAIRVTARLEGLILDPAYTAKAMAGLIGWVREGRIGAGETVVFWHTGGQAALFASGYAKWFAD